MDVLEKRRSKAYDLLTKAGFEKALLGDPLSILYLTGIHVIPYERFYGLILDAKNKSCHMINPSVDTGCMKGTVPETIYKDEHGPKDSLLANVGQVSALAVETKYFSMATGKLLASLGCEIVDIGDTINRLRMFKDEAEIEKIQAAAAIVDDALAFVKPKIKVGMTEKELNFMLYAYMTTKPGFIASEFIILVLAADNAANPHGSSGDYAFKEGDILLLDFCAYCDYYWADITRCLFVGSIGNPKLKEIYNIAKGANLAAIAAVKPGVKAKDVDKAARDYITNAGYGEYFIHRTGHGLGLSVHEEPYITSVNELVLEEGMTFTIEPGIYLAGIGGVRVEDDILVTKDGCRIFTSTTKDIEAHIIPLNA